MKQSIQTETAAPQDVMATLRDLLQTLREVLARMPVMRDAGGSTDGGVRNTGAIELADMMRGRPTAPLQQNAP